MRVILFILTILLLGTLVYAQEKQGVVTDMVNDKKNHFSYTTATLLYDNNYLTRYLIEEKSNQPLRKILLNYDKNNGQIEVTMFRMNQKDTIIDKYNLKYHDSLGLIFTQRRTVTELLKGPYELVLCFKDSSKTFLELLQVMNQSTVYKKHYLFRLLTSVDVTNNTQYLRKHPPLTPPESDKSIKQPTENPSIQKKPETKPDNPAVKTEISRKDSATVHGNKIISPAPSSPLTPSQPQIQNKQNISPTPTNNTLHTVNEQAVSSPVPPKPQPDAPKPVSSAPSTPSQTIYNVKLDSIECLIIPSSDEMVSLQIIIKGGILNYPYLMQGIEPLLLYVLAFGATRLNTAEEVEAKKNALMMRTELWFEPDYSVIHYEFPRSSWNDALKLIGDQLGKPAFEQADIEEAKGDVSLGAHTAKGDLWQQYRSLITQSLFLNQAYAKTPWGEGMNMGSISAEALKKYYNTVINRNNIEIAVLGKVSPVELRIALRTHFRWLNWGVSNNNFPSIDIQQSSLNYIKNEGEEAIATCACNAVKPGSSEYTTFLLTTYIIEDKIRKANMSKKPIETLQLTYSSTNQGLMFIQFTAVDADKAMQLIIDEIKKLKRGMLKPTELNEYKEKMIADYYINLESAENRDYLMASLAYYNNPQLIDDLETLVQKVSVSDIQNVMIKYVRSFKCLWSGDEDAANPLIFTQKTE